MDDNHSIFQNVNRHKRLQNQKRTSIEINHIARFQLATGGILNGSSLMGTSRMEDFQSIGNSEAGTFRDAYTSPSA